MVYVVLASIMPRYEVECEIRYHVPDRILEASDILFDSALHPPQGNEQPHLGDSAGNLDLFLVRRDQYLVMLHAFE